MAYADLSSAKAQLDLSDAEPDDAADIALLAAIDAEISRTLELKTGRQWGGTATPTVRTIDGPVGCSGADILLLPEPARSIAAVAITGDDPATLAAYDAETRLGDWIPWHVTKSGDILALRRVQNGRWPARNGIDRVAVTGVWSDEASGDDAPQEVVDAATFVAVETFRQRKSSPTGEIGPDGFTVRPRNPWKFELVLEVLKRYGAANAVVSF